MTSRLEDVLNIASNEKEGIVLVKKEVRAIKKDVNKEMAKAIIDPADLDDHDKKMDEYAEISFEYAKEIYDLGMNIDPRFGAEMFNAVSNMMKVALDAKNAKLEKKLKLYDLELKKQKLDFEQQARHGNLPQYDGLIAGNREDFLKDED